MDEGDTERIDAQFEAACGAAGVDLRIEKRHLQARLLDELGYDGWVGCGIYFKYCSTFDSTARGNIGPVADALLDALGERFTVATPS